MLTSIRQERWESDARIAGVSLFLEFMQLALFVIDPVWGWAINWQGCAKSMTAAALSVSTPVFHFVLHWTMALPHAGRRDRLAGRWARRLQLQNPVAQLGYKARPPKNRSSLCVSSHLSTTPGCVPFRTSHRKKNYLLSWCAWPSTRAACCCAPKPVLTWPRLPSSGWFVSICSAPSRRSASASA